MCGIAGYQGRFEGALLETMSQMIRHRGPDDSGSLILDRGPGEPVGLAHRRLSIIDLSPDGRQPMSVNCPCCGCRAEQEAADRLWIVYNGELYNYPELRRELESRGHHFTSQSDTEVLVHLYAEQGPEMLSRLNGIFAFVIYDGRSHNRNERVPKGGLFAARDGLGVKPFYYAETNRGFLFSSELKSLVASGAVSLDLDLEALHHYLAYLYAPAPRTPLKKIKKLGPGMAMVIQDGRIKCNWCFYDLPYGQGVLKSDKEEICQRLDAHLERAVKRQMLSDVPVGAFLSGGLDSSAVVSMMRKVQPDRPITAYCIDFEGGETIEGSPADLPYARQAADHLGIELRPIVVSHNIVEHLEDMIYYLDEPVADPSPIHVMLIARQARQDGYKVLLSGTGGDDIFSGYRRHKALYMERFWGWAPKGVRTGIAKRLQRTEGLSDAEQWLFSQPWFRRIRKAGAYAGLSGDDRLMTYFYWSGEKIRRSLYSPDMGGALREIDTAAPLRQSLARIPSETDPLNRMLYLEAKHFLADHNLNYTDKASMAMGVETRVPLLDVDLIKLATQIPPALKHNFRNEKAIFKKTMEPHLPRSIIYRRKTGFGAPMKRWLHEELRDVKMEMLSPHALSATGLFDPVAVQRVMDLDRRGMVDATYTIFSLICIQLWIKIFLDAKGRLHAER